jgi:uncharacterized Fe-S cluster-containing MiaB family protein
MTRQQTPEIMEFQNSPLFMSEDEEKRVSFDASAILDTGELPASAVIKVYELTAETDVTTTIVKSGTQTITPTGVNVTLKGVVKNTHYRVEVKLVTNYNTIEGFLALHGVGMTKGA